MYRISKLANTDGAWHSMYRISKSPNTDGALHSMYRITKSPNTDGALHSMYRISKLANTDGALRSMYRISKSANTDGALHGSLSRLIQMEPCIVCIGSLSQPCILYLTLHCTWGPSVHVRMCINFSKEVFGANA